MPHAEDDAIANRIFPGIQTSSLNVQQWALHPFIVRLASHDRGVSTRYETRTETGRKPNANSAVLRLGPFVPSRSELKGVKILTKIAL